MELMLPTKVGLTQIPINSRPKIGSDALRIDLDGGRQMNERNSQEEKYIAATRAILEIISPYQNKEAGWLRISIEEGLEKVQTKRSMDGYDRIEILRILRGGLRGMLKITWWLNPADKERLIALIKTALS